MKFKRIANKYFTCIKSFGVWSGNRIFYEYICKRLHIGKRKTKFKVRIKKLNGKAIYLRRNTTDLDVAILLLQKNGEYDFLLSTKLSKFLDRANFIIDGGANIGIFSCICRYRNSSAKIVCIEPEDENYKVLLKNMDDDLTRCYQNGLWNKKAKLITVPRNTGEWGFAVKEVAPNAKNGIDAIDIPTIMDYEKIDFIDILKIDIEGSEVEVFDESCENWIEKVGIFIIEFHDRIRPESSSVVLAVMEKHGFMYEVYGENYVFMKKNINQIFENKGLL